MKFLDLEGQVTKFEFHTDSKGKDLIVADYQTWGYVVVCEFRYNEDNLPESIDMFYKNITDCNEKYQKEKNRDILII